MSLTIGRLMRQIQDHSSSLRAESNRTGGDQSHHREMNEDRARIMRTGYADKWGAYIVLRQKT